MKKIKLYIAVSLDGKIAGEEGDVSWPDKFSGNDNPDYGYNDFLDSVDTTLMGNKTYRQLLNWGIDFPYRNKLNYVFTRNMEPTEDENVKYISIDPVSFVKDLKSSAGDDIWLIGGGQINTLLLNAHLIDELIIFIIPEVLGKGIPLFANIPDETNLDMIKTKTYDNGVVEINYRIKNA